MPGPLLPVRLQGHTKQVSSITFFNDGQHIVTCSLDRTLRIWDIQKKKMVGRPFEGHTGDILSVTVSPDDRQIASGGEDETIIIWDVKSRRKVVDPLVKHTDWVHSVCFSPDGKSLASGSDDTTVVIWDTEIPGAIISILQGHRKSVLSVAFSSDGQNIVSGSSDRTVRVWRVHNADLLFEIPAHEDWVRSVVWSPDDEQLVSASNDGMIRFWDAHTGHQTSQTCTGHNTSVCSLAISFDHSFVAIASFDKTVRLWSTEDHRWLEPVFQHSSRVYCVAISPSGVLLASAGRDGNVYLWSIPDSLQRPDALTKDLTRHIVKTVEFPVARGWFGDIWKCKYSTKKGPIDVAVKALHPSATYGIMNLNERIQRELMIWTRLKHPNIMAVYGYTHGFGPVVSIVSLWARNGNLQGYLKQGDAILTPLRRFEILRDIAAGLQYLHAENVIHGNLTDLSVFIHENGTACLGGFILSWSEVDISEIRWMAPELLGSPCAPVRRNKLSDIYSFGGIMLQVITSQSPYYYLRNIYCVLISLGTNPDRSRYPAFSDRYWDFIERCWSTSPRDRPSAHDAVAFIGDEFDYLALGVVPTSPTDIKEAEDKREEQEESDDDANLFDPPNLTKYITKDEDFPVTGGGFGQIWKCTYSTDQGFTSQVAVKSLLTYQYDGAIEKKTRRIRRELGICARLKHPNIISVYGYTYGFGPLLAIVSPWAENGNLTTYLKRHEKDVILNTLRRVEILRDIATGLDYLHANKVVHGDLTSPNVLIHGNGIACLADFGLSLIYSEEISTSLASCSSQIHGTIRWLDPELLGHANDTSPVKRAAHNDIYSFGGVILQVLAGKIPYYYLRDVVVAQHIDARIKPLRIKYPSVSDKYWDFITACWSDVETRPTANKVVEWINDEFDLLSSSST